MTDWRQTEFDRPSYAAVTAGSAGARGPPSRLLAPPRPPQHGFPWPLFPFAFLSNLRSSSGTRAPLLPTPQPSRPRPLLSSTRVPLLPTPTLWTRLVTRPTAAFLHGLSGTQTDTTHRVVTRATRRSNTHQTPRTTRTSDTTNNSTQSRNPNFKELVKCLNRAGQLQHHNEIWTSTPRFLHNEVDTTLTHVTPPMNTPTFQQQIASAKTTFKTNVTTLTATHIQEHILANSARLQHLDPRDKSLAAEIALKQLHNKLPRANPTKLRTW